MSKICTFDFDKTLVLKHVQEYAIELINDGYDLHVLTTRYDDLHMHLYDNCHYNNDLWNVIDSIGLPRWKVFFTNMTWKAGFLSSTKVIWHLDDNPKELLEIKKARIKTIGIQVHAGSWKNKCNRLLKRGYYKQK